MVKMRYFLSTYSAMLLLAALAPYLSSAFAPATTTSTTTRLAIYHGTVVLPKKDTSYTKLWATNKDDDVYTIQILMSDTGGGHRASANALRDAFDVLYPGKIQCDIVDLYTDYGPFWPYNDYVALYKIMAKYDFLWDAFYKFGETDFGLFLNEVLLETFCFDSFKQCLGRPSGTTDKRADMVISVHPLCQDIPLKILSELDTDGKTRSHKARTTPFVTVVTDLGGAHKTWFNPNVDKCFVPSDVLDQKARQRGLGESQIVQYGLPIRKGFWSSNRSGSSSSSNNPLSNMEKLFGGSPTDSTPSSSSSTTTTTTTSDKKKQRASLGIDPNLPTVLIVGGGDGMGGIVEISTALGNKLGKTTGDTELKYQMVVVCGKNKEAQDKLSKKSWGAGVKVVVQGFVNNMDEWMNASDALVTKAGPGTIAEASICGLPCMLFAYLPGQEEGNIPFVEEAGFGKYSGDPAVIAETVSSWLSSPEKLKSMQSAALAAARPSATLDIAKDLAQQVFATRKEKVLVAK